MLSKLLGAGAMGALGYYSVLRQSMQQQQYYTFDPHRAPPQFSDADLEEHALYDPDMKVTQEDIARIEKKVQETGERLPRGRDRQMMLAHLYQLNKQVEQEDWKKNATGLLALCAYGPTCWNANNPMNPSHLYHDDKEPVCWDCGKRHS